MRRNILPSRLSVHGRTLLPCPLETAQNESALFSDWLGVTEWQGVTPVVNGRCCYSSSSSSDEHISPLWPPSQSPSPPTWTYNTTTRTPSRNNHKTRSARTIVSYSQTSHTISKLLMSSSEDDASPMPQLLPQTIHKLTWTSAPSRAYLDCMQRSNTKRMRNASFSMSWVETEHGLMAYGQAVEARFP